MFDVFVSYKAFNADGSPTVECKMAQVLARCFEQAGIRAFFSEGSYKRTVMPGYGSVVDSALTESSIMLVLVSDKNSVNDRWVEYEWRYFSNAVNSGVKRGCLLTVLNNVSQFELPPALANAQTVDAAYLSHMPSVVAQILAQIYALPQTEPQTAQYIVLGGESVQTDSVELDFADCGIEDISELIWLRRLRSLKLPGNRISDLSALTSLHELELLDLSSNNISDISPIGALGSLRTLELWNNRVFDLSPLASLGNLETLRMWRNYVSDLEPLTRLSNLRTLELSGNRITDVSPLARIPSLRSLELGDNGIADISPLGGLTGLTTLWLNNNRVSDLSPLAELTELETLHLEGNADITDLEPLYALPNLRTVWLTDCPGLSAETVLDLRYEKTDCAVIY